MILNINEDITFKKDLSYNIVTINDEQLRGKSALLLKLLQSKINEEVTFDEIMSNVWGLSSSDWDWFHLRSMDVYLSRIRKVLNQYANVEIIRRLNTSLMLREIV